MVRPWPDCTIVIPTLDLNVAAQTGRLAMANAGCDVLLDIVIDTKREGFTRTANRGLRTLSTPYVCLLNDDAIPVTQNWLVLLREAIDSNPEYGFAGPSGRCRGEVQSSGWEGMPFGHRQVLLLSFFCTLIKKSVIDEVGLLDEDFAHYGSDNFYQLGAHKKGWRSVLAQHVYVEHEVGETIWDWKTRDKETLRRKIREQLSTRPSSTITTC